MVFRDNFCQDLEGQSGKEPVKSAFQVHGMMEAEIEAEPGSGGLVLSSLICWEREVRSGIHMPVAYSCGVSLHTTRKRDESCN